MTSSRIVHSSYGTDEDSGKSSSGRDRTSGQSELSPLLAIFRQYFSQRRNSVFQLSDNHLRGDRPLSGQSVVGSRGFESMERAAERLPKLFVAVSDDIAPQK